MSRSQTSQTSVLAFDWLALLLIFVLFFSSGCRRSGAPASPVQFQDQTEITVAAASNLSDAMAEVARQFTAKTGIRVVLSFGATGDLSKQIENGAPFDVFAAADREHIDTLNLKGLLVPDTVANYARGVLVLWSPPGAKFKAQKLEDVTAQEVGRIAVAKPDLAPYGRATIESLRALGLWDQVSTKVVYGENVSQVKQYAATGNVDLAFVPLSLVRPGEGEYVLVPASLHQPIDQAMGVMRESKKQDSARQFAQFVLSPEGQAILKKFGYEPPR
ncbi:MAG: molybdate ABC transporter substrate-binding protein [Pyrinomonadaceae bacterium]